MPIPEIMARPPSDQLLSRLLENPVTEVTVFAGAELVLQYANGLARRNLGLPEDHHPKLTLYELFPSLNPGAVDALVKAARNSPEGHSFRARQSRQDGTRYAVEAHLATVHFRGRPAWLLTARDVSTAEQAAQDLKVQVEATSTLNQLLRLSLTDSTVEQMLQLAVEALGQSGWLDTTHRGGAWLRDPDGSFVLVVNDRLPRPVRERIPAGDGLIGEAAACRQILYRSASDSGVRRHSRMVAQARYAIPVVIDAQTEAVIVLYLRHDHQPTESEVRYLTAVSAALSGALQQRQTDKALRQEVAINAGIMTTAADAIIRSDAKGCIVAFNPAAENMFGWTEAEVVGKPLKMLMPEETASKHDGYLNRLNSGGAPRILGRQHGTVAQRRDGSTFPMELSLSRLAGPDGTTFTGIVRDISARQSLIEELGQAREAAIEASRAKSRFLANVSHEIRTPMNGIMGMAEHLLATESSDSSKDALRTILESSEALLRILDDVLDLSKVEAGRMELDNTPVAIGQVVRDAVRLMEAKARASGIALDVDIDDNTPDAVLGDPVRLRQVVLNLVGNAVKFTAEGGVRVFLTAQAKAGRRVTLRLDVEDTGVGIPAETIEQLFQPFTQADVTTTRRFGGTGLGLTISRQLVELMGGRIEVSSKVGEGSTFTVILPVDRCDSPTVSSFEEATLTLTSRGEPLRVLVVEDNLVNQRVVALMLERLGAVPVVANNGVEAVEACARGAFDLVLMDHQMPVMDGLEAARAIRASGNEVPIVALTADAMPSDARLAMAAGMDDHIAKPVRGHVLSKLLLRVGRMRSAS